MLVVLARFGILVLRGRSGCFFSLSRGLRSGVLFVLFLLVTVARRRGTNEIDLVPGECNDNAASRSNVSRLSSSIFGTCVRATTYLGLACRCSSLTQVLACSRDAYSSVCGGVSVVASAGTPKKEARRTAFVTSKTTTAAWALR